MQIFTSTPLCTRVHIDTYVQKCKHSLTLLCCCSQSCYIWHVSSHLQEREHSEISLSVTSQEVGGREKVIRDNKHVTIASIRQQICTAQRLVSPTGPQPGNTSFHENTSVLSVPVSVQMFCIKCKCVKIEQSECLDPRLINQCMNVLESLQCGFDKILIHSSSIMQGVKKPHSSPGAYKDTVCLKNLTLI